MARNVIPNFLKTRKFWAAALLVVMFTAALRFGWIPIIISKLKMIWTDYNSQSLIFLSVVILIVTWILFRRKGELPKLVAGILFIGFAIFLYKVSPIGKNKKIETANTTSSKSKKQDSVKQVKKSTDSLLSAQAQANAEKPLDSITQKIQRKRFIADSIQADNRKREIELTAKAAAQKKIVDSADVLCSIDSRVEKLLADAKKIDSLAAALARSTTNPCEYVKPQKKDVVKNTVKNRQPKRQTGVPVRYKRERGVPTVQFN